MNRYKFLKISKENNHIFLLLFWLFYVASFFFVEKITDFDYHIIECWIDYKIPFCEFFIFPYVFWYLYLAIMCIYSLIFDVSTFKKFMRFIIITFIASIIIHVTYPNIQLLRPTEFERNNFCVDLVKTLYVVDTNTNVLPSVHALGSLGVSFAAWNCKGLNTMKWRVVFTVMTILIFAATLFLKQHSVLDLIAAIILSVIVYPFCFAKFKHKNN